MSDVPLPLIPSGLSKDVCKAHMQRVTDEIVAVKVLQEHGEDAGPGSTCLLWTRLNQYARVHVALRCCSHTRTAHPRRYVLCTAAYADGRVRADCHTGIHLWAAPTRRTALTRTGRWILCRIECCSRRRSLYYSCLRISCADSAF